MKIHRFFLNHKIEDGDDISITDEDIIHQMKNVLRLRQDDPVILLDGTGKEYHTRVKILLKKESNFSKENVRSFEKNVHRLNLFFAIPKKDKAEWILQKCTELGVDSFTPVISDRTEKINLKSDRMKIIIKEAAEQSEKVFLPELRETVELAEIITDLEPQNTFYLDFDGEKINLDYLKNKEELNIFVGPEGGWSDEDKKLFEENKIKSYSLGNFVLRAETASIAITSILKVDL